MKNYFEKSNKLGNAEDLKGRHTKKTKSDRRKNKIWVILFFVIVFTCFLSPLYVKHSPGATNLANTLQPPSKEHFFGTDTLGRDVFSRTLFGGIVSLSLSGIVTFFSIMIGLIYGGISGYKGGIIDSAMMRIVDVIYCIPSIIIVMVFQMVFPNRILGLIIIMSLTKWMTTARIVRARFLELKESGFVMMARCQNIPEYKIVFVHMTRNTLSSLVVISTFTFVDSIMTEAILSFLGVGIPLDTPSLGNMINNAQTFLLSGNWWIFSFPGLFIILSSLCVNFTGEFLKNRYTSAEGCDNKRMELESG